MCESLMTKYRNIGRNWETGDAKRDQPRICTVSGKKMYANEGAAKATAAHRMLDKEKAPEQLRTYKCLYCGAWHLTSKRA